MKRLSIAILFCVIPVFLLSQDKPCPAAAVDDVPAAADLRSSESARLVESLDGYTLGRLSLHFPRYTIKVHGTEIVDREILFRATFFAQNGTAVFYQDELRTTELLRGSIRLLCAEVSIAIPGTSTHTLLKVRPSKFRVEIQSITASVPTGLAGNLNVKNRYLILTNIDQLTATENSFTGRLDMRLTDATLDRIKFNFAGTHDSLTMAATLSLPKQSEWLIELATGRILWESGTIRAKDIRIEASEGSVINMGGVKANFRKLTLANLRVVKRHNVRTIIVFLTAGELDIGSVEIKNGVTIAGTLKHPMTFNGWWWGSITDDGQVAASFYDFDKLTAGLTVSHFEDTAGFALDNGDIELNLTHLCVEEMTGAISVTGGDVKLAGSATGSVSVKSFSLAVSGPTDRLSGNGTIALNSFKITTEVNTPVLDRCTSTMPLKISDAQGVSAEGTVKLTNGRAGIDITMDEFSTRAGLGYYRCEWDQKVGDLGRWEVCGDVWCPTWSEPFRTCRQCAVIWDGGPVYVHWVVEKQPSIIDAAVAIKSLRIRIDPEVDNGKLKLCGGRLKFLSPSPQWFSIGPNVQASGTVADVFRDIIKLSYAAIETEIVTPSQLLASAFGSTGAIVFGC